MVLLTFVWKCFQDRNFHGVVVGLYEQSIESWVGLIVICVKVVTYLPLYKVYREWSLTHSVGNFLKIGNKYLHLKFWHV